MLSKEDNLRLFIREALDVRYWTKNDDKLLESEDINDIEVEFLERGNDFVEKCIKWCYSWKGDYYYPHDYFKDNVVESFNCVYDLTFKTKFKNLKELKKEKKQILKKVLYEKFDRKKNTGFENSYRFRRLHVRDYSHQVYGPSLFYIKSFDNEDFENEKNNIENEKKDFIKLSVSSDVEEIIRFFNYGIFKSNLHDKKNNFIKFIKYADSIEEYGDTIIDNKLKVDLGIPGSFNFKSTIEELNEKYTDFFDDYWDIESEDEFNELGEEEIEKITLLQKEFVNLCNKKFPLNKIDAIKDMIENNLGFYYDKMYMHFFDSNRHLFEENLDNDFIVITSLKQLCDTPKKEIQSRRGRRGTRLVNDPEGDWRLTFFFVCKKEDSVVKSIISDLEN